MDAPTARGLANAVAQALAERVVAPGDRLPPIRTVAVQLGLSPTTVSAAWGMLARAGTIQTDGRRGTLLLDRHVGPTRYRRSLPQPSELAQDLSSGTPDPRLLPAIAPALRRAATSTPTTYLDDPVRPELAAVLRADWPFAPERLTVVDGAMDALQLIASVHLRFGDRVAVEQPCFPPLLDLLDSVGAVLHPVGLDDDGPLPDEVSAAAEAGARALFLQPRAQNPTGASLSSRRLKELAVAVGTSEMIIVEDDSAGAIAAPPATSLGAVLPGRTLHIRSFSKSHGPDLRLAALGGPAALVDPVVERRFLGQGWTSRLLQGVLCDLLTHAPSIRAVERARGTYARRRAAMVVALADEGITIGGRDGLNIWVPVNDESAALLRLASDGIGASAGGPFHIDTPAQSHLRLTVGLAATGHRDLAARVAAAARLPAHAAPR